MSSPSSTSVALLVLLRPRHWVKNLVVFLPVLFAGKLGDLQAWVAAGLAAAGFCLVASAVYVINDLADRKRDRMHPAKRNRPLAAGHVSIAGAVVLTGVVLSAGMGLGAWAGLKVLAVLGTYFFMNLAYSLGLKHAMILDVILISTGFVLRALAGAIAIGVVASPWLLVCTFTACLFLAFCKRYNEVVTLAREGKSDQHRPTLAGYQPELLSHLMTLSAAVAVLSFLVYALSPETVARLGTHALAYTLPMVVYGIARFAMLSMIGRYDDPTDLVFRDRPFQLAVALWLLAAALIVRWGSLLPDGF